MTRVPLLAGNWKMNHGGASGANLALGLVEGLRKSPPAVPVEVVVAPPFTGLAAVSAVVAEAGKLPAPVEVSGQNFLPQPEGAFTGEVNAAMLLECGCKWVLVGHSERRQLFGETDEDVAEKVAAAFKAGLRPIVCVGETLEEREANRTLEVVHRQVDAFAALLGKAPGVGVIAYEPVWAIGTGRVAGPEQAQEVHAAIRERLTETEANSEGCRPGLAQLSRILYGGSVKPGNAASLLACPDVDGALVGGASLDAESFLGIISAAR